MRSPQNQTRQDRCTRCHSELRSCRCRGVELDGRCERPACTCWSELCCECGDEYARRFVGVLLA